MRTFNTVIITLFSSVQLFSHVQLFATPWTAACQASLSITNSQSLPKLISIESVMPSNIPSSVVPFSSCPQSLPASGSFPMSQLLVSGGQSIGVSASTSVLPMNTQDWSPLGWTGWISLQSKGLSRVFSSTTVQKHQFFGGIVKCLPEGVDLFAFPPATMRMPDSTASPTDIFFFPVSLVGNSISSS